jgi:hypothetical protein
MSSFHDQTAIFDEDEVESAGAIRSKIRQVVIAWAYNFPSGPIRRPSAVATCRPPCTSFPSARTSGTASVRLRTIHRRIEKRSEPSAVHGAQRVVMLSLRSSLKDGQPTFNMDWHKVERVTDRRARQFSCEDRLEHFQTGITVNLVQASIASAGGEPRAH